MIKVELRKSGPRGSYETLATLQLNDDNSYVVEGPRAAFLLDRLTVLLDDGRRLRFDDDRATWLRNLHRAFRTPYRIPVITEDTHPGGPTTTGG
jgi:hypothetical protein